MAQATAPKTRSDTHGQPPAAQHLRQAIPSDAPTPMRAAFADPAARAKRHSGVLLSLCLMVAAPMMAAALYLFVFAQDQYASTAGVTIRQDEAGLGADLLGGVSRMIGGSGAAHTDLLYEYIRSQAIVTQIDAEIGLRAHFSVNWPQDPLYALPPVGPIDDLVRFWQRIVRVTYDKTSGMILIETRARDPATAQHLAQLIVRQSERMINQLNVTARADALRDAQSDLNASVARLRRAREAVAEFRARTQIIDPTADMQSRMGVLANLQQQLAQALVEYDLLAQITDGNDTRARQALRRIDVIRQRILEERQTFSQHDVTVRDTDYPRLIAQYESLLVDQEIAQQSYSAAIHALDIARSHAQRQSLYLALFIPPTLSEHAAYPQRGLLVAMTGLFSFLIWAVGLLGYYSLRDRN